ncbi:MAG: hypothetical protein C5B60_10265 [Chloroflexi bacterium]|nr:MAG: hypothetical protein C5B60_10265 [Chloroflexota bacterium]
MTVPTITGTAVVCQTLTANIGDIQTPVTYQWNRGGTPIIGATASTYQVTSADVGFTLTVTVTTISPATALVTGLVPVNTAAPTISGTAQVGVTLTASTGTWMYSPTSFTYQWVDSSTGNIGGATSSTYVPVAGNVGHTLTVSVIATNATGSSSSVSSSATASVTQSVPVNTVLPTITGTAQVGQTLTASNGTWTNSPTGYTYQWNRAGSAIGGATSSTYVPVTADIGSALTVSVVASNAGGSGTAATSAATSPVIDIIPTNTAVPTISGTAQVGQLLTASTGAWTHNPTSYTYQWAGNGTNIGGATSSTYTPVSGDLNHTITVSVVAINSGGSSSAATSPATAAVLPAVPVNTVAPTISGVVQVGQTLTATSGTWTNSPTSYAYQWNTNGMPVGGATATTYVPITMDIGKTVSVTVIASNSGGAGAGATSLPTSGVAPSAGSGLPSYVGIGIKNPAAELSWIQGAGVPWNYRYQYLNSGWETWNSPSGQVVTNFINDSISVSAIPVFDWYVAGSQNNSWSALATWLANTTNMNTYFTSLKLMLQKAGAISSTKVILHVEPDMCSFAMQQASGFDPRLVTVSVASSGFADVSGLPNTLSGLMQAFKHMRDLYASNVLIAWDNSVWSVNFDPTLAQSSTPQTYASYITAWYALLSTTFDLTFFNVSDRDSAYKVLVLGQTTAQAWWVDTTFDRFRQYLTAACQTSGFTPTCMLWQVPIGNTLYLSCNNTIGHYQDNRPQYFLATNRQNLVNFVNGGLIAILFGEGIDATDTSYWDALGDGITNPAAINGNTQTALYSDDDGGNLRLMAGAYYSAGPIALGTIPSNISLPLISGTAQVGSTLTATPGSWTNNPTSYAYQWKRAGAIISGAISPSYVPIAADIGSTLTVSVVATNATGSGFAALSAPTSAVVDSTTAFIITGGPTVSNITTTGVTISWSLSAVGTGQIQYGLTSGYGSLGPNETSFNYSTHIQQLSGLTASTTYHFRVVSTNQSGTTVYSPDQTFVTSAVSQTLIFPPNTTSLSLVSMASPAVPSYLSPVTTTDIGNKIMRISDYTTFGGSYNPQGGIHMIKHHYAKDSVWNCDESLIFLSQGVYPGALLDGTTYAYLRQLPSFTTDGERVWSNTQPNIMYGVRTADASIRKLNVQTGAETIIASFPSYSWLSLGANEGNISNDDRYACFMAQSGTSLVVFTFDLTTATVLGSQTFANTGHADNINFTSVTPSGQYAAIGFNVGGPFGFGDGTLQIYDIHMNHLRGFDNIQHVDFIYDMNGDEVVVGNKSSTGDIFHMYIYSTRLSDGRERVELPVGSVNNGTHTSCRNINRPGWAYFSQYSNVDPSHPITWYNGYFNYNEVFAVRLDGSGTIERYGKEYHEIDANFNTNTNDGYDRAAMAVPSRKGDRVVFASDWLDSSTSSNIHEYVVWWPGP